MLSVPLAAPVFIASAAVIGVAGIRMTRVADHLADRTGLGEALVGALFVGGATSLPGLMTTVFAARDGLPTLSVSNAVGGIAVQTLWLVIGDLIWRRANLEHAAASPENLLQGALLISLLSLPLLAMNAPPIAIGGVLHPVSPLLVATWILGMRMVRSVGRSPMWKAAPTSDTVADDPEVVDRSIPIRNLWIRFLGLSALLGGAGYTLARSASALTRQTILSESVMGGVFTAAASSLPELVVVVTAVRTGAHTMAVSNIIGGNALDTLFLSAADVSFARGSIYHAISPNQELFLILTILMTSILLAGQVRRQRSGWWRIGFGSVLILAICIRRIVPRVPTHDRSGPKLADGDGSFTHRTPDAGSDRCQ